MNEPMTEDFDVWPTATGIRTIDPNDLPSLNADCDLISDTGAMELVRIPLGVEWMDLSNSKVSSIDSDLASLSSITVESVLPANLWEQQ